jgi:copper-(or silver)-translocating P-type ATPase
MPTRNQPALPGAVATEAPITLDVEGMSCASCVGRVEKALRAVPGVAAASVNLASEKATVHFSGPADPTSVVAAIEKAGYAVGADVAEIRIEGMSCASCVSRIEKALSAVPGVTSATVNLATEKASVTFPAGTVSRAALEEAVRASGYEIAVEATVTSASQPDDRRAIELRGLKLAFGLAALLTVPLFIMEMGSHFVPPIHDWIMTELGHANSLYIQFALATAVVFGPGLRFYRKGIPNLLRLAPDMNSLVALGTGAAWSYSVVATFLPGILPAGTANVYYEAAAVIVTLILLGRFLEARAKGRTNQAIKRLIGLQPKTARVVRDGVIVEMPLEAVSAGDRIQIRPGDRIPVDGTVVEGSSYVDESMITGEPVPVLKGEGVGVVGGTVNRNGSFTFTATKVGAETVLAQIIRMVEAAQGSKLPIQALVDKVTAWFVPAVMAIAVATFLIWLNFGPSPATTFALVNAVAVLIIACPCAMGLATPTSIMVGTGRAAEMGILFRKGEALQTLRSADIVALDKTGTLTEGKPKLTDLETVSGFERDEVLALVAAVESRSEHPIAEALVEAASHLAFPEVTGFSAEPGFGVSGTVMGRHVLIGADRAMLKAGVPVELFESDASRLGDEGKSPIYVAVDGQLAAIVAVADPVKATSSQAVQALHDLGLKVAMITGDNGRTARAVAARLGIDEVVAEMLPDGKVDAVKRLKAEGRVVAFVGDGINDAPALAEADVGLAVGTGTEIAIESADVVLMSGDLLGVANAIAISKATLRNIKQNLFWAFAYNVTLIPVAAGVLYPVNGTLLSPMLAAGAMALSSVFVLGNALRLKGFSVPTIRTAETGRAPGAKLEMQPLETTS